MANVKTAISLQESLFEEAETLARELKITRSHLFALAVQEFIQRHQSQKLLEAINAAYADQPDPAEQELRRQMRQQHRRLVEGQW
jgi:metal-responsive CopG/Arc/MetJ family transcriptional regulator